MFGSLWPNWNMRDAIVEHPIQPTGMEPDQSILGSMCTSLKARLTSFKVPHLSKGTETTF